MIATNRRADLPSAENLLGRAARPVAAYRENGHEGRMKSSELTKWQAYVLKNKIQPMLGSLNRLKRRMHDKGFHRDDPLMQAVVKAFGASELAARWWQL